ncbi:MAG TPA: DUF4386 domain-containing protein [Thermoanaerobaculia bacterium]|jgi:hypothetical protein
MDATKKTARLAGLLYLLSSLAGAPALLYVPGKLIVEGDAAATADRLRASGGLLRLGIGSELAGFCLFVFVALVLYRLFRPVSEAPALAMLVLILLSIPITFFGVLFEVAALDLAGPTSALSALDAHQRDALAYECLRLHGQGFLVAQVFWGLWLFPFGTCVIRSGFIPRFLGVFLWIAAFGYLAASFAGLVVPQYREAIEPFTKITALELPIIFWLLIRGARTRKTGQIRLA